MPLHAEEQIEQYKEQTHQALDNILATAQGSTATGRATFERLKEQVLL